MQILVPILYCLLFLYSIYALPAFKKSGLPFLGLSSLFLIKIVASVAMYYIYTVYYPIRNEADMFKYFDDSQHIFAAFKDSVLHFLRLITGIDIHNVELQKYFDQMNFWNRKFTYGIGNDNRTIIRINAIFMLFSGGNIWVHNIFASYIAFVSYFMIYRVFVSYAPHLRTFLIISIFLIPSSVFWTSSILKETIVVFGLALFFHGFHALHTKKISWKSLLILCLGIFFLISIKLYVLVALIPAALAYVLANKFPQKRIIYSYILVYVAVILAIIINQIGEIYPVLKTFANKRNDFITDTIRQTDAQSYIPIGYIKSNLLDFIKETPHALYRALFLPWIWNVQSFIQYIPAFEKLLMIILFIISLFFHKKQTREIKNLMWFSGTFTLGVCWIVGMTTPVVGAIVRYTVPVLPFLYTIFVFSIDWEQILRKFNYGRNTV